MESFRTTPADHRFFTVMAFLAAMVVTTGFARTYPIKATASGLPSIVHLHAAVFACWLVVFVAQAMLVKRGRVDLHRRLGVAGILLAVAMLAVGGATAVTAARLGHKGIPGVEFPDPGGFLLLNLSSLVVFSTLVFAGWCFRRSPEVHKRLMLTATVGGLMPPGIARLPLIAGHTPAIGALAMAFLLAGPVYDLISRRRLHAAYLLGVPLAILAIPPIVGPASATEAWRRVALWLMQ